MKLRCRLGYHRFIRVASAGVMQAGEADESAEIMPMFGGLGDIMVCIREDCDTVRIECRNPGMHGMFRAAVEHRADRKKDGADAEEKQLRKMAGLE